jgi:hypothetical protein
MDDLLKIEKSEYRPSEKVTYSTWDVFWLYVNVWWTFTRGFFECLPDIYNYFKNILFGIPPKDIRNQVALSEK